MWQSQIIGASKAPKSILRTVIKQSSTHKSAPIQLKNKTKSHKVFNSISSPITSDTTNDNTDFQPITNLTTSTTIQHDNLSKHMSPNRRQSLQTFPDSVLRVSRPKHGRRLPAVKRTSQAANAQLVSLDKLRGALTWGDTKRRNPEVHLWNDWTTITVSLMWLSIWQ